ncbi:MAG: hypothetical protein ACT4OY_07655 [Alphaproteobacteria bacterium]
MSDSLFSLDMDAWPVSENFKTYVEMAAMHERGGRSEMAMRTIRLLLPESSSYEPSENPYDVIYAEMLMSVIQEKRGEVEDGYFRAETARKKAHELGDKDTIQLCEQRFNEISLRYDPKDDPARQMINEMFFGGVFEFNEDGSITEGLDEKTEEEFYKHITTAIFNFISREAALQQKKNKDLKIQIQLKTSLKIWKIIPKGC